jgi:hypothetical protein
MLFKEFYNIQEVSTCRDLKTAKNFAYSEFDATLLGDKLDSFVHEISGELVPISMYIYKYDEERESEMLDNYIWIDERNKKKVAQLSYITIKVKLENTLKKVIAEKYFFVVEEYRGFRLITPIYDEIVKLNTVSPGMLASDVKQSPSMNKFWKSYLIPKYKATPLVDTKVGSNIIWTLTTLPEGQREIARLIALKKIDITDTNVKSSDDAINGKEKFNQEHFRILLRG